MVLSAYSAYKKSNSPWLGDIPVHWGIKKLKFLAVVQPSNVDKKTVDGEEPVLLCNYTDVYKNEYINSRLDFMQASATEDEIKKFAVDIGDVIVTKDSETPGDIAVPACVTEKIDGLLCGYHLTQIKPIDLEGKYLFRLFQSKGFNAQFTVAANGVTRFGLPQYAIANAFTPVPPIDEQQAIARFLDFKTAQIDALIAKKQALLGKLAEKRTALISHAVTKGLDSSVPMKDSGVAWLGEIPAHWKILPLKYAVTFQRGHDLPSDDRTEGEIPLVSSAGISSSHDRAMAKGPGIVTGRYGTIGKFTYVESDYWPLNTTLYSIATYENNAKYLWYMMHILSDLFILNSKKGAVPGVDRNDLHPVLTAIPLRLEQDKITVYLDSVTAKLDIQAEKINEVISRLIEYRSALITNAVTGKIDVRDVVIPTPAEPAHA